MQNIEFKRQLQAIAAQQRQFCRRNQGLPVSFRSLKDPLVTLNKFNLSIMSSNVCVLAQTFFYVLMYNSVSSAYNMFPDDTFLIKHHKIPTTAEINISFC